MTTNTEADVLALAEELLALAEKASPAPWSFQSGHYGVNGDGKTLLCHDGHLPPPGSAARLRLTEDEQFIAFCRNNAERIARALSRPVPEGFVLVPKEPTNEMIDAVKDHQRYTLRELWRALIAAAPSEREDR